MYICICVDLYISMYAFTNLFRNTERHLHLYTCARKDHMYIHVRTMHIHACTHWLTYTCKHMCVYGSAHVCTHIRSDIDTHVNACEYLEECGYMYICKHMQMCATVSADLGMQACMDARMCVCVTTCVCIPISRYALAVVRMYMHTYR